jgi:streptomycin 6-kinase
MSHLLAELAELWGLELMNQQTGHPLERVVAASTQDGADAVLKLASPSDRFTETVLALRAWNGRGAPRLLAFDEQRRALLLERVRPGTNAVDATPAEAGRLIEALGIESPSGLPRLDDVVRRRIDAAERGARASRPRVAWARTALERLTRDAQPPVLLHGVLDERNVLRCESRILCAIDPAPCAGDAAYDAACWIHANGRAGRRARFDALAGEFRLDRSRLRDWCGVIAVHG